MDKGEQRYRGKVRDRDKERPYTRWDIRKLRPSRLELNLNVGFVKKTNFEFFKFIIC